MSEPHPELTFSELGDCIKKLGLPVRLLRDLNSANYASTLSGFSAYQPELYRRPIGSLPGE